MPVDTQTVVGITGVMIGIAGAVSGFIFAFAKTLFQSKRNSKAIFGEHGESIVVGVDSCLEMRVECKRGINALEDRVDARIDRIEHKLDEVPGKTIDLWIKAKEIGG